MNVEGEPQREIPWAQGLVLTLILLGQWPGGEAGPGIPLGGLRTQTQPL